MPPVYDPAGARRLLDSLGWRQRSDRTGAPRERAGRVLRFAILTPGSSATRQQAAVLIQQMLAAVGVQADVERRDNATMIADLRRGAFDAALVGLRVDPDPAGVQEAWGGAAAASRRGFNFGGYSSAIVDGQLDSARWAVEPERQRAFYRAAYRRIVADVPAVFLYEPDALVAYNRRLRPSRVRADAWWADLAAWEVR